MPPIGNKKITDLIGLTSIEVQPNDLFVIVDITANESKKIQISDVANWLNMSGSFHILNADSASFILGSNVYGSVISASYALTASYANNSLGNGTTLFTGSIYQITASYALNTNNTGSTTASYLLYSGSPNGTSSYAIKSLSSDVSQNAMFLSYFGGNNGTASYAITSGQTNFSINAATASYFNNAFGSVASASHAINADTSSLSNTTTGTASYALQAGSAASFNGVMNNYGVVNAYTQSLSSSIIDTLIVSSSLGVTQSTIIQSIGNAILFFTSSVPTNYTLSLFTTNRLTGNNHTIDSSTIGFNTTPMINTWGSLETGSMNFPFNLIGQSSLYGKYLVEVTSSSPYLYIDSNRLTKFIFSSKSNILTTQPDEIIQFFISPSSSVIINFSSSAGGPFIDNLTGLLITGSQNITWIDIHNQNVNDIRYTWKCNTLTNLNCSNNPSLQTLFYSFPASLQKLQCYSCSLNFIADLNNTTMSYFNCSNNNLTLLPKLSVSTSYLDFSYNNIMGVDTLPTTLTVLYAQGTSFFVIPSLPNSILTASFANTQISDIFSILPSSMSYLDISNTLVSNIFSALPVSMSYLNLRSASFHMTSLENVSTQLVNNGMVSGTLNLQSYGHVSSFSPTLLTNIGSLQLKHWNVLYDL